MGLAAPTESLVLHPWGYDIGALYYPCARGVTKPLLREAFHANRSGLIPFPTVRALNLKRGTEYSTASCDRFASTKFVNSWRVLQ
jgi:hypothetical protein